MKFVLITILVNAFAFTVDCFARRSFSEGGWTPEGSGQAVDVSPPPPQQPHYDFIVAPDGSGNFKTIQEAFNAVPNYRKNATTILLRKGTYKEKLILATSKT